MITVVSTPEEVSLLRQRTNIIITGVGAINVYNALKNIDREETIYNAGYVGSNAIPTGTTVRIGRVGLYHPNVDYIEKEFVLDGNIPCYTSSDFVISTNINEPCVFDMELAFILAMGFKNVVSEKTVSDCLNLKEYEKTVGR